MVARGLREALSLTREQTIITPLSLSSFRILSLDGFSFDTHAQHGGALAVLESGVAIVRNCTFVNNKALYGGALYMNEARGRGQLLLLFGRRSCS